MIRSRRIQSLLLLSGFLSLASAQISKRDIILPPSSAKTAGYADRKHSIHNGNKILTRFYNYGGIGNWTIAGRYDSGIFPQGSGRSYIAEFTPVVTASVVNTSGYRVHIASDGMVSNNGKDISNDGRQWGFDPLAGYADPNQSLIAMSDNPDSWPEVWPDRPDWLNPGEVADGQDNDGNGFVDDLVVWNGQYGKYARADQESYFVMNDYDNDEFSFYPDSTDSLRRGLGLEVAVRGYQWAHVAAEDIIIWTYWITNKGTSTLDSVVFGMYGDADIGDDGDQRDDDSWFDQVNDIVYQWDHDNWSNAKGGFRPAYFGWKFLESPGNSTDGIDNDGDGLIDESQFDGIDNDGDWDPEFDDLGTDGLGPQHQEYTGPDADGTEGNGVPDLGEPNFEYTDNGESDQIGLTSFFAATWPNITASDDEKLWDQLKPGFFSVPEQTVDITFLYGSGYFTLQPGERKKFSVAMLFGEDNDDILRNAVTMQAIYDADYNFAKPPKKPTLTAVPGDGVVTLYWDDVAETSRDPVYGYDFEGYRIYRATDPALLEPWIITDAYGHLTYRKPIAQFDLDDGLAGLHPVSFNGVQFNVGTDSGLRHYWSDTTVQNGQKYYYAIASYDKGYYENFYDLGLSEYPDLQNLVPTECAIIVKQSPSGAIEELGVNVAEVTPNAPSAGYVPANLLSDEPGFFAHDSGNATGKLSLKLIDPNKIHAGWRYAVEFTKAGAVTSYAVQNLQVFTDTITFSGGWSNVFRQNLVPGSLTLTSLDGQVIYVEDTDFTLDPTLGILEAISANIPDGGQVRAAYRYYPLPYSTLIHNETLNPLFDGMQIMVQNTPLALLPDSSGWIAGDCDYIPRIGTYGAPYPADYEIRWEGSHGDSVSSDEFFGVAAPFTIWNITDDLPARYVILETNQDKIWDPAENIVILSGTTGSNTNYNVKFTVDSLQIDTLFDAIADTIIGFDTTIVAINHVEAGDVIGIYCSKPFSSKDVYSFTTTTATTDLSRAHDELGRIAVVPNPYVIAASWEPQHVYVSGRGQRKVDFIHLPRECTIRIFTMAGFLVKTIDHFSALEDGSEPWDMLSRDGLEIAYGIYIYHVDAPGVGEKIGKFAVIK